ncbi:hypothetical protein J6I44_02585 [Aliifodinibius sp. 1BSP15-2V2]|uniref:Glycosyl hydrolase family 31 C-terminal domain-containing protein n=2 Tax=Fodinibius salsisoli TaxID=2820877 RepID=A0ABT3PIH4_9BACT|nr:hypothetical protein [Fodinibius salsisoli]
MYGKDILVSPVIGEKDSRKVYLPEGSWVDVWDHSNTIEGPTTIEVQTPLFARNGAEKQLPDLKEIYKKSLEIAESRPSPTDGSELTIGF